MVRVRGRERVEGGAARQDLCSCPLRRPGPPPHQLLKARGGGGGGGGGGNVMKEVLMEVVMMVMNAAIPVSVQHTSTFFSRPATHAAHVAMKRRSTTYRAGGTAPATPPPHTHTGRSTIPPHNLPRPAPPRHPQRRANSAYQSDEWLFVMFVVKVTGAARRLLIRHKHADKLLHRNSSLTVNKH
ncbi:hypothetical protein E2C01_071946 [Portunus trituberculatus]|uniref:Uncharacterized protein n=1 Tax=Portunus trituberculatus TaxID=210409 RepID=A0A5B7HWP1_PORTR|nr:hypothetical protein [Portunus trituberculatus]